jgi:GT2 family glycosyltransferase/ubiquinone/menaquinone biosynthesis C-methylase UbiE/glycosyltransferase involved in cell wall biosynthesis
MPQDMQFTGERFIPTEQGRIRLEHYHRYAMVVDLVRNKCVLDVASGSGYGSAFMAEVAHSVVGIDIAHEAVAHASSTYVKSNLKFQQGSATKLDFADASFEVVVSFETIEHLYEQEEMLAEIRRVLRPEGVLVISSPNRPIYAAESGEHNEFHVKELDFKEFDDLLKMQFQAVEYFGQRIMMGSVIQPLEGEQSVYRAWCDDGINLKANAGPLTDPVYFVAICAAAHTFLAKCEMSVLYPEKLDLVKHYVGFAKWAQDLDKTVLEHERLLNNQVELRVQRELQLFELLSSNSWFITKPLREIRRLISSPVQQLKKYVRTVLQITKKLYLKLPLSAKTKASHRQVIAKYYPKILLATHSAPQTVSTLMIQQRLNVQDLIEESLSVDHLYERANSLDLQGSDAAVVSVVIPIYGKIDYTIRCLISIAAHMPQIKYEVIVVDDCSPDNSLEILSLVKGIRVLKNEKNQGFIRSCNAGAKAAKGQYLYFLNNDTQVTHGWLDELHRTFEDFPGTGLAGSKLIYPDGRLQEAGGIVWQDASAWNFGRLQDPFLPEYSYAREVDYISGASIMLPRDLFDDLGGFDEYYLPAYYEDADLAFKIHSKGYRVVYQPLSAVIHFEGITSGTDTNQGAKAYQIENQKKFYERWKDALIEHQVSGINVDCAKDRQITQRILVIDHCTPTPDQDAGSLIVFNLLILMREMGFQVTFIPEDNFLYMPDYTAALQRAGIEVLYAPFTTNVEQHLKTMGNRYALSLLIRPVVVERHLNDVRRYCSQAQVLFHTVDLHFLRMSRELDLKSDELSRRAAEEMKQRELTALRSVDAAIVVSTTEKDLLDSLLPEVKIHVLPLIMDIKGTSKAFSQRKNIVFVGGFQHTPNVDAVKFFVDEIFPLVKEQLPEVCFYVVGSHAPIEIQALASESIVIAGFIEDLNQLLDKMRVSVAPLRYGAGIKGKIGSAMAVGLPVVATTLAADGMSLTDGKNILVADKPQDIANSIVKVYQDEALWNVISQSGIKFADQAWGAEASYQMLYEILISMKLKIKRKNEKLKLYGDD